MPLDAIVRTARSLAFYRRLEEVTANNVANASTDAFKADRLVAWLPQGGDVPAPVQRTDLEPGRLRETGRPLDLAFEGEGYFVVATPRGERLMRGGSLRLDTAARLTDAHGAPLLGTNGPIVIAGDEVQIAADGTVKVDGASVDQLRVVRPPAPEALRKEGYGRFSVIGEMAAADRGSIRILHGSVEDSNVDPVLAIVDLVSVQRAYSANADALKAIDGVLGTVANQVGRVE